MKDIILSTVIITLLVLLVVMNLLFVGNEPVSPLAPEQVRTLASALESQGLYEHAIEQYKRYLDQTNIPANQRANILYRIGTLYLDELQDYENALAAFLQVSHLYPHEPIAQEAEKRMVKCFEELNRGTDAQRKLKQLTDLEPDDQEAASGPVVAQIGDRKITRGQLEQELNQLPETQRKQFDDPERRREYLQSKLFEELLYDMALRKEYDKDRQIRQRLHRIEKMMLAQKVLDDEVYQKIQVSQGDVELYYKANPEEFTTPLSMQVAHIQVDSKEKAQEVKKAIEEGLSFDEAVSQYSQDEQTKSRNGLLGTLREGSQTLAGLGQVPDIVQQLLPMEEGAISSPIQSPQGYHIFKITQRTPEKLKPLDEVKSQAEARVRQRKAKELQDALMQRMLKAERVKIFDSSLVAPDQQASKTTK